MESLILAFKSSGLKVKTGSGTKKLYTLQGFLSEGMRADYWVMNGAGHIVDGEDYFEGEFSGTLYEEIIHCTYGLTESTWMVCKNSSDGFTEALTYYLVEEDEGCKSIKGIN